MQFQISFFVQTPKTENTQSMFNAIAHSYDRLNHLLSVGTDRRWRRRSLKRFVKRDSPQEILDLACGTGDYSIAIARCAHPDTRVTGVDLSEGMLEVMRSKVKAAGLEHRITAEVGNGEHLRFADNSFDCVAIAFGIRNFEHREQALAEILRVLKPDGRLVILELSVPASPVLRWCYNLYFTKVLPWIGGRISGEKEAYRYLPESVLAFPGKKEWMATMRQCGYSGVSHKPFTFGICRMYIGEKRI